METNDSNIAATIVSVVLYILALLTVARLFISPDYRLPEKLRWMNRALDVPYLGPVVYFICYLVTGRKIEKHTPPPK